MAPASAGGGEGEDFDVLWKRFEALLYPPRWHRHVAVRVLRRLPPRASVSAVVQEGPRASGGGGAPASG